MVGHVGGVVACAVDEGCVAAVLEPQPDRVETGRGGDPAFVTDASGRDPAPARSATDTSDGSRSPRSRCVPRRGRGSAAVGPGRTGIAVAAMGGVAAAIGMPGTHASAYRSMSASTRFRRTSAAVVVATRSSAKRTSPASASIRRPASRTPRACSASR